MKAHRKKSIYLIMKYKSKTFFKWTLANSKQKNPKIFKLAMKSQKVRK